MIVILTAAGTDLPYTLLATALDRYGLMGVFVVGVVVVAVMYQRNESKKIDLDIQRNKETEVIKEETQKVAGLVEQMQREVDSSLSNVQGTLSEVNLNIGRQERGGNEIRATQMEIKTQLRELSRDVNRSN